MKTIQASLILFSLAILFSCGDNPDKKPTIQANSNLQVEGYKVIGQSFNTEVLTTAEIRANEQVELRAPISGQVLDIHFKEGEMIKKGQALIKIDDRHWNAELMGVKAALTNAQKDYDRKTELLTVEGSSQEEVDHAFTSIEALKSQLAQLRVNIELANVSAPFSGRLGMRNFSKGAFLQQGDMITTLTESNQLKVDLTLAQHYIQSIEKGKTIWVLIAGDTIEATIYAINPVINANTRTINLRALLKQPKFKSIVPGTFAEALVTVNFIENALLVPTQAVVPSLNDQIVYTFKNGKAVKNKVQVGNRTKDKVHIIKGIAHGDTIITTGLLHIKEEMDITLQSIK